MGGSEPLCPACGQALHATEIGGASVRVCGQCHGTLVAQIDMIRAMEAMSVELLKTVDPDVKLEPAGKSDAKIACPSCSRQMSRDDYCGAGLAHFDRCEPCRLLWLGADALGTMTMMWARMERRLERTHRENEAAAAHADEFAGRLLLARATAKIIGRFL